MPEDDQLAARRRIIAALLFAAERPTEVLRIVTAAHGELDAAAAALRDAFAWTEEQSHAVLNMQVRRFTPLTVHRLRNELQEIDTLLGERGTH